MLKIRRFYAFLIFVGVVDNLLLFLVFSRKDDHKPTVDVGDKWEHSSSFKKHWREKRGFKMVSLRRMLSVVAFVVVSFLLLFLVFQQPFTINDQLTLTTDRTIDETSDDSGELKKQLKRQDERKQNVKVVCRNLTGKTLIDNGKIVKSGFLPFFVDDHYKFLYCQIPKIATTSWRRILLILTGKMNTTNPYELDKFDVQHRLKSRYLRRLDQYTENEIRYRLENYYKFMFVREPFERLLSAYRGKLIFNNLYNFRRKYGRRIIKLYRTSPSKHALETGEGVKFEEFVKYLLNPNFVFDSHWELYHKRCHPCFVQYDFIGKYETLKEDFDLVMTQLGIRDLVKFPDSETKGEKTSEIVAREFENISEASFRRLWEIYSSDFSLFGYKYPSFKSDR